MKKGAEAQKLDQVGTLTIGFSVRLNQETGSSHFLTMRYQFGLRKGVRSRKVKLGKHIQGLRFHW